MIEIALRYEINTKIPDLKDKTYPTNAPEGATGPYLVYARISTNPIKTLEGYTSNEAISYMFSIMAVKYSDMVRVRKQVKELLVGMIKRETGNTTKFFIEDLDINNIDEQYEHALGVNRGIIDFTIYY